MEKRSANWRHAAQAPEQTSKGPWLPAQLILLLALLASLLIPQASFARERDKDSKIHPQLFADMQANPDGIFRVIVQRTNNSERDADTAVEQSGGKKHGDMKIDGFIADLSAKAIEKLAKHPKIKAISPDAEMISTGVVSNANLVTLFPRSVWADGLWTQGITGSGVGIAVIDSGINNATGDFGARVVTRQVFVSPAPTVRDPSGHGTLVAGIAAGNSWNHANAALRGRYMGIAPEANLIDLVVTDASGKSYTSSVVNAIEWAIANRTTYNIRVMNLSLVSSVAESYRTSILAAAVEKAWFSGIFVVVSAGNAGANTLLYPPANDPFVLTVGASDMNLTADPYDDKMATWSSYGTTQDGFSKPDVVAPGRFISGPVSVSTSTLFKAFSVRAVPSTVNAYMWMSGTSMSAPVIAGIAALAFQANPHWTNDQMKWAMNGGWNTIQLTDTTGSPLAGQGAGLVMAPWVVWHEYDFQQQPLYANQGLTRSNHLVVSGAGTTYNSASWSSASWSSASWSSASWSSASWSSASWSSSGQLQSSSVDVGATGYKEIPPGTP